MADRAQDQGRPGKDGRSRSSVWPRKIRLSASITNEDTGQTIIAGMGELHLEIIRDRMLREFKVDANAGKPQIAYRETITEAGHGEGKLIKQSGGRGQYGHVDRRMSAPPSAARGSPSKTKSSAAPFRRNTFRRSRKASKRPFSTVLSAAIPSSMSKCDIIDGTLSRRGFQRTRVQDGGDLCR